MSKNKNLAFINKKAKRRYKKRQLKKPKDWTQDTLTALVFTLAVASLILHFVEL